jgi:hypothetical protein
MKGTGEQTAFLAQQISNVLAQKCGEQIPAIAAIPDSWQLKAEAQRPQLAIVYLEKKSDGTLGKTPYSVHIPHFNESKKDTLKKGTFPDILKGNHYGILTLKDNSKITVNCKTQAECERVLDILKTFVLPDYLKCSIIRYGERKDSLKEITVIPHICEYFKQGAREDVLWRKSLNV